MGGDAEHERALDRFRLALNLAQSEEEIAATFLCPPPASVNPDAVAMGMLIPDDGTLRVLFVGDVPGEYRDRYWVVAADGPGPMAECTRTGETLVVEDTEHSEPRHRSVMQD